jgi:hypothetical protein
MQLRSQNIHWNIRVIYNSSGEAAQSFVTMDQKKINYDSHMYIFAQQSHDLSVENCNVIKDRSCVAHEPSIQHYQKR